jgi:hypothetical protein
MYMYEKITCIVNLYIIFLTDDKQKTKGISNGSNAIAILSSALISYYASDYCSNLRTNWTNINA